jgi:hypothetical protein
VRDADVSDAVLEDGIGEGSLHRRKPRKQRRVMGWELSRQLKEPCGGGSMVI